MTCKGNKSYSKEKIYESLLRQLKHIDLVFVLRRHIHIHHKETKWIPKNVTKQYLLLFRGYKPFFEMLLIMSDMYLAMTIFSCFVDETGKCTMRKLLDKVDNAGLQQRQYDHFIKFLKHYKCGKDKHPLMRYIKIQRNDFYAHANFIGQGSEYPQIWETEYYFIIEKIRELMDSLLPCIEKSKIETDYILQILNKSKACGIRESYYGGVGESIQEIFDALWRNKDFLKQRCWSNHYDAILSDTPDNARKQYQDGYWKFNTETKEIAEKINKEFECFKNKQNKVT